MRCILGRLQPEPVSPQGQLSKTREKLSRTVMATGQLRGAELVQYHQALSSASSTKHSGVAAKARGGGREVEVGRPKLLANTEANGSNCISQIYFPNQIQGDLVVLVTP